MRTFVGKNYHGLKGAEMLVNCSAWRPKFAVLRIRSVVPLRLKNVKFLLARISKPTYLSQITSGLLNSLAFLGFAKLPHERFRFSNLVTTFGVCLCNTFRQKSKQFSAENPFFRCLVQNNSMETLSYLVSILLDNGENKFPIEGHGKWVFSENFSLLSSLLFISTQNPNNSFIFYFLNKLLFDVE